MTFLLSSISRRRIVPANRHRLRDRTWRDSTSSVSSRGAKREACAPNMSPSSLIRRPFFLRQMNSGPLHRPNRCNHERPEYSTEILLIDRYPRNILVVYVELPSFRFDSQSDLRVKQSYSYRTTPTFPGADSHVAHCVADEERRFEESVVSCVERIGREVIRLLHDCTQIGRCESTCDR